MKLHSRALMAAVEDGNGRKLFGNIEYDESSRAEALSVFVPLIDRSSGEVIAVTKAVVDVAIIKAEL